MVCCRNCSGMLMVISQIRGVNRALFLSITEVWLHLLEAYRA